LFLSSGVVRTPDYTMERLVRVVKDLRTVHRFNGYIHLKSIPGASRELVDEAGLYADRMSVNIEIPNEASLKLLAPEKDHESVYRPMEYIQQGVLESAEERKKHRHAPRFVPAGQSTQMIVGATGESDRDILFLSSALYGRPTMRRVYYSGYVAVNTYDPRLPALKQPPLVRENRLYQADWLMRFYQFKVEEIVDETHPDLDLEVDPKLAWALRHPEQFPVDVNRAEYERILRVPGIGVKSARLIVCSRRFGRLTSFDLKKMGCVMKRAQYFITCGELEAKGVNELYPERVRSLLVQSKSRKKQNDGQLTLLFKEEPA
jgi:putative DNA modification/repair radical SAM protein